MAEKRISNKMHDEAFRVRNVIIEREMNELRHLTYEEVVAVLNIYNENKGVGTLTVNIDCSDALKGLKAVTREAKKATAALKELEDQQDKMNNPVAFYGGNTYVTVKDETDMNNLAEELYKQMQKARARGASI